MTTNAVKNQTDTKEAVRQIVLAVSDAIKELKGVPSGHLYARLMGFMSLDTYNTIVSVLESAGKIKVKNHFITWME